MHRLPARPTHDGRLAQRAIMCLSRGLYSRAHDGRLAQRAIMCTLRPLRRPLIGIYWEKKLPYLHNEGNFTSLASFFEDKD